MTAPVDETVELLKALRLPHMRRAGRGNIVNVTSIAARIGGGPGAAMYASAKAFVSTFTRGIARELVKDGIRVNAVSPGVIETPFHERYSTPQMLETFRGAIGFPLFHDFRLEAVVIDRDRLPARFSQRFAHSRAQTTKTTSNNCNSRHQTLLFFRFMDQLRSTASATP